MAGRSLAGEELAGRALASEELTGWVLAGEGLKIGEKPVSNLKRGGLGSWDAGEMSGRELMRGEKADSGVRDRGVIRTDSSSERDT